jgi:hypothetical protein
MHNGKLTISDPKSKAPFLWKYFDIHSFIYLLMEEKLFFTRLDNLDDPYEGVATKYLREGAEYSKVSLEMNSNGRKKKTTKEVIDKRKLESFLKAGSISKSQKSQFVNCWFAFERESMAMWNLYSNEDSVALKANFKSLKKALIPCFKSFIAANHNSISVVGDEITYLGLNPFDEKLPKQKLKYSAFKKDLCFQYEKEYRFLLVTKDKPVRPKLFYAVPVELEQLDFTVIAHPNMEDWKFDNLKTLLKLSKHNIEVEKSAIFLRKKA